MNQHLRQAALVLVASLVAEAVTAQGVTPWSTVGRPLSHYWSSIPGYSYGSYTQVPLFNRYSGYLYSGVTPLAGYGTASPRSFLYQRPALPAGPYGYIQGWVTPQGDFEGTMVVRGNMRKLINNYYNNLLYKYYLSKYYN